MINLLPPEGQATVKREYWLRVITVWALLLSALSISLSLILIPMYVLYRSEFSNLAEDKEQKTEIENRYKTAMRDISDAGAVADYISSTDSKRVVFSFLDAIHQVQTSRVEYRSIVLERKNGAIQKIQLQGEALARADLIALRSALERSPLFGAVSVPLSDLARDTNLPFVITIAIPKENQ